MICVGRQLCGLEFYIGEEDYRSHLV